MQVAAEIIVAIADHHQDAAHVLVWVADQLAAAAGKLLGGLVDGVVKRGAAAGALLLDDVAQRVEVAGKVLDHLRIVVHGHQKGLVLIPADHVEEKIDGRFLFELQTLANAIGSVQQQAHAQRQVGLAAEKANILRAPSSKTLKLSWFQVGDDLVLLTEDR